MDDFDPSTHLGRPDKWYLGAGDRLTWTPPHPQWIDTLGFWDEAHVYDFSLSPLFTITLLREGGTPLRLQPGERHWQPDRLRQTFEVPETPLTLTEEKTTQENDVLASTLTIENDGNTDCSLHAILWTLQPVATPDSQAGVTEVKGGDNHLHFRRRLSKEGRPSYDVDCAMGFNCSVTSNAAVLSESGPNQPYWQYTPFYETFSEDGLGPPPSTVSLDEDGVLYLGIHATLTVPSEGTRVTAALKAAPKTEDVGEQGSEGLNVDPPAESTRRWREYFETVPTFQCSDPYLQHYYWYRWYGLRLFTRRQEEGNYQYPAVYEGPEYFRKLVSYSAQCHMLEMRWHHDGSVAHGSLLNFIENQRPDGRFIGHLYPHDADEESFYHANWSHAWAVYRTHPDPSFLQAAYDGLSRYVRYFDEQRDPENSGLYDIWNHYETGQEYMHRYQAVSETADEIHWGRVFRLKGVDAAVQMYQTKRALARMADVLDRPGDAEEWVREAGKTKRAVLNHMWDPEAELFFDVDPETGACTDAKAAVCFYPYFTNIVDERHRGGLKRRLFNPEEFWTSYPVPASSRDDAYFSAVPHWKGQRKNCPWNGRVWPMTNSHIAEAICQAALRYEDSELREKGAAFITRFVQMMFDDDTPHRPNCFEHYNPHTGQASRYRGINDYQHSWIVDLLVKYAAGIRPGDDTVTVDPFPFDVEHLALRNVPVRDSRITVTRTRDQFAVSVDGESVDEQPLGAPITLDV